MSIPAGETPENPTGFEPSATGTGASGSASGTGASGTASGTETETMGAPEETGGAGRLALGGAVAGMAGLVWVL